MKRCSKCGERKALKEFHRDRRHSDGRRSECILCESAHKQSYYTQNQSSIRTRRKVLHRANPEKNRKWCRKWRADHPEYTLAANRHITIEEALAALAVKPKTCEICGRSVKLEYDQITTPTNSVVGCVMDATLD